MKTKLLSSLLLITLLSFENIFSQQMASDSKGESVFTSYSFDDYKINISTAEPLSVGVSLGRFLTSLNLKDKAAIAGRNSDVYVNYGLLNSGDQLDFNKLNDNKFGHSIKLGYQNSVVNLQNLNPFWFFKGGGGVAVFYNVDNFNFLNSETMEESSETPASYGLELNSTIFITETNVFTKLTALLAFEAKYYINTWNSDELLNYQTDYIQNGTVVAMEDFKGKYGILKDDISKLRVAGSLPLYYGHFNLTPYTVLTTASESKPSYRAGTNFNIIQAPIDREELNFGSSFGIGIDWLNQDGEWSQANIFLRGSISFGKI
ncbi:MAG: hypothetical protein M0D53_04180 [Flavobacterium sp. JAD_PAG50586_2]|nr:MAG: hypothetical protein M0D53_04180 [Flavobacterium sp. JAD_PAG50586_2]